MSLLSLVINLKHPFWIKVLISFKIRNHTDPKLLNYSFDRVGVPNETWDVGCAPNRQRQVLNSSPVEVGNLRAAVRSLKMTVCAITVFRPHEYQTLLRHSRLSRMSRVIPSTSWKSQLQQISALKLFPTQNRFNFVHVLLQKPVTLQEKMTRKSFKKEHHNRLKFG